VRFINAILPPAQNIAALRAAARGFAMIGHRLIRAKCCAMLAMVFSFAFSAARAADVEVSINPVLGTDARVDYARLLDYGPWDDRNYALTQEDLALLAPNEAELYDPIPAFFRVELRRAFPQMKRSGALQ
jgi:hypothetical protein